MVTFYRQESTFYRQLLQEGNSAWIINMNGETAPQQVSSEFLKTLEVVPADAMVEITLDSSAENVNIQKRLKIIKPLIEENVYIKSKPQRLALARKIADKNALSSRTVLRYYFAYLAQGVPGLAPASRKKKALPKNKDQKNIEKALNQFFYSASRMTLHMAYEMMLLNYYKTPDGLLNPAHPTYNQFRYHFRKTRNLKKEIVTRQGIGEFQKNQRPLTGAGNSGIENIGFYEIDATIADIYLVSKYDRKPIGRPYVYMTIDVASRLIAGIYVGLAGGSNAVLACIANSAADKVEFCHRYGIDITPEQWPSQGLPGRLCTDRGNDFTSDMVRALCETYQIEIINLPPYRPDLKGYIEKAFDCLQSRYKPLLHGMGVIEDTATANGAPDYYSQACLDLDEFTRILIECVLYYNTSNILNEFKRTPEMSQDDVRPFATDVWHWYESHEKTELTKVDGEALRLMLLPRSKAQFTRFGLKFRWLYYTNKAMEEEFMLKAATQPEVTIAYNEADNSAIYLIQDKTYIPFELTLASKRYQGLTETEMQIIMQTEKDNLKMAEGRQLSGSLTCNERIMSITKNVERQNHSRKELEAETIKLTREKEKRRK